MMKKFPSEIYKFLRQKRGKLILYGEENSGKTALGLNILAEKDNLVTYYTTFEDLVDIFRRRDTEEELLLLVSNVVFIDDLILRSVLGRKRAITGYMAVKDKILNWLDSLFLRDRWYLIAATPEKEKALRRAYGVELISRLFEGAIKINLRRSNE